MSSSRAGAVLSTCLALLMSASLAAAAPQVQAWEGEITLPTYPWYDSPYPEIQELGGRIVYPYSMQDDIGKEKRPVTYRALFLENEYLRVTCLPALGGRIHSVLDKTTGEEMFHLNDEIKPALIAMRGAWVSGGIEWNTGPQGHTVTAVSPVDAVLVENEDGSASLVIGNTEKIFRTRWTVRLTLHPGRSYLDERIRIFNPTDGVHPYYFWNCTAFPCRPGTRFIFPMTLGTDHDGTTFFSWPEHEGRDLTWLKNYPKMTSVFAYQCAFDFFGAYDVDRNQGIVAYANHFELQGKKAWTWGQDDFGIVSQMSLSDGGREGAPYIEVQSGPLRTQAEYGMLDPHEEVSWQEWWYPVHGLGDGFEYATRDVAVQTHRFDDGSLDVRMIATGVFPNATVSVGGTSRGGPRPLRERQDLSPSHVQSFLSSGVGDGPVVIGIQAESGEVLARFTTPLDIPRVEPPDLTVTPAREDGRATVGEIWQEAQLLDRQSRPIEARARYLDALAEDPGHAPSLHALAVLDLEEGRYAEAAERLEGALRRDETDGMAWYHLGVTHLRQGRPEDARRTAYRAAFESETRSLGHDLVGRAEMVLGRPDRAIEAFRKAVELDPRDTRARDHYWAAMIAAGRTDEVIDAIRRVVRHDDPTAPLPRALLARTSIDERRRFTKDMGTSFGNSEFAVLEAALALSELGLGRNAYTIFTAMLETDRPRLGPLGFYYMIWFAHESGEESWVRHVEPRITGSWLPLRIFPSRPEAEAVLRFAIDRNPEDARAHVLLGHLLAGLHRVEEAVPCWRRAVELDPSLFVAWRNLALYEWRVEGDLPQAEQLYRRALGDPGPFHLYYDLARVLTEQGKRPEAIELVEPWARLPHQRADLLLWLAQSYLDEARYDDVLELLARARFSSWEGGTRPHDLFASAHLERGKLRFEAGELEPALEDFTAALTWPANLEVGRKVDAEEAEACYWKGRAFQALGRTEEALAIWRTGADAQPGSDAHDLHRALCAEALVSPAEHGRDSRP